MQHLTRVFEDGCIILNTAIGLSQIESLLGIIILSFQIILILVKGIKLIINHIKNKDIDKAIEETENLVEKLNEKKDEINK